MRECSFLHAVRCQSMFQAGDVKSASQSFEAIAPEFQEEIRKGLVRSHSSMLYVADFLFGRVCQLVGSSSLDLAVSSLWEKASCYTKAAVVGEWMQKYRQYKLSESVQSKGHSFWPSDWSSFVSAPIQSPPPERDWLFVPALLMSLLFKVAVLPWGLYSLYRYIKDRDQSSREVGISHMQGRGKCLYQPHQLSQASVKIKDVERHLEFFGLFDGEVNSSITSYSRSYFIDAFMSALHKYSHLDNEEAVIFAALRSAVLSVRGDEKEPDSGAFAMAIVIGDQLFVCTHGSSQVMVNVNGSGTALSGPSGSDGSCLVPSITKVPLGALKGGELVIATRGLWESASLSEISKSIERHKGGMGLEALASALSAKGFHTGFDGPISTLLVKF